MMTIGEQRHMAVVESSLRRIAEALESINAKISAKGAPSGDGVAEAGNNNNN